MTDQRASEEILINETESTPIEQVEKEFMPKIEDKMKMILKDIQNFLNFCYFFFFSGLE